MSWTMRTVLVLIIGAVAVGGLIRVAHAAGGGTTPTRHVPKGIVSVAESRQAGLDFRADLIRSHGTISVLAEVVNQRRGAVELGTDVCGRAIEVVLRRTDARGAPGRGSARALKTLVVNAASQEHFVPRNLKGGIAGACPGRRGPVRVAPGAWVKERWELPHSRILDTVGSSHAAIDILALPPDGLRHLEVPAADAVHRAATASAPRLSPGREFDRLLALRGLRAWIAHRPATSWSAARLLDTASQVRLDAVSAGRHLMATMRPDGTHATFSVSG